MNTTNNHQHSPVWLSQDSGSFYEFSKIVSQKTKADIVLNSISVEKNIPLYSGKFVSDCAQEKKKRKSLTSEWVNVLTYGPGVIVIKNALSNHTVIDRATHVFSQIIKEEKSKKTGEGDHFAQLGANDRIWNALEKHCLTDPENFTSYYSNDTISLAAEAWLGHGYQMTSQVNQVNPGGAAQKPHRDYHLGFMMPKQMEDFPAHIHQISPLLTLQGAVAHCDMPIISGPTHFLPFSQQFFEGYLAFDRPEFQKYFDENYVQLPLEKGDMVFFNPAVMHRAGNNTSNNIHRIANLLQISSAFGRAMEAVNRVEISKTVYPILKSAKANGQMTTLAIVNVISCCAEGYSFPTNLDRDPPVYGLAPKTQSQIMVEAIENNWSIDQFNTEIDALSERQKA